MAAGIAPRVADYLWKREMISGVYRPRMCQATLWPDGATAGAGPKPAGTRRRLWTFVARREHVQYYPGEDVTQTVKMIRQGVGTVGANTEYLFATVQHLDELGIPDRRLHRLAKLVRGGTGC